MIASIFFVVDLNHLEAKNDPVNIQLVNYKFKGFFFTYGYRNAQFTVKEPIDDTLYHIKKEKYIWLVLSFL